MLQTVNVSTRNFSFHTLTLLLLTVLVVFFATSGSRDVSAQGFDLPEQVLIHHWNFNEIPNDVDFSNSDPELLNVSSRIYGAFLSYDGARWDRVNEPTPLNAREEPYLEEDDRGLRLRNPAGALTMYLPTTGYRDVVLCYAVLRTSSGAHQQRIAYSIDGGETFTTEGIDTAAIDVGFYHDLVEVDFTGIEGVGNNPDFQVRITLTGENSGPDNDSGNQRFNNITLDGYALEPDIRRNLIHYWALDDIPNDVDFPTNLEISAGGIVGGNSSVGGAWLRYDGARWDRVNAPTPFNARTEPYDEDNDRALRLRNPTGDFLLRLPTTGYKNVMVRYAVKRTDNGAQAQQIAYSTDGSTFRTDGLRFDSVRVGLNYILHELDFTEMDEINENPDFTLRIRATGEGAEPGNQDGNQRFNHITVDAVSTDTSTGHRFREVPDRIRLEQNYPNPFNPVTQIGYRLPIQAHATLDVFDITGRHIRTLVDQTVPAGLHTVPFDASELSSGLYMYRLQAGSQSVTRRMIFIK